MGFKRSQKRSSQPPASRADKPDQAGININSAPSDLPEELIAARAYEKWQLRGCPMGQEGSDQDWHAARAELEAERLNWAAPQADDAQRGTTNH
jgi:hypothetical protein